jgi:hypothetical protein
MVSTDGNVPHPDLLLNGRIELRLSTARGLVTALLFKSCACDCMIAIPLSSMSFSHWT